MRWLSRLGRRDAGAGVADEALLTLLREHGLSALEGQLVLQGIVGERDWQFDLDAGVLRFGDDLAFQSQCLGSEADRAGTWLWAWANPTIYEPLTELARRARDLGEQRGWTFLVEPEVPLDRVLGGHFAALALSGLLGADAYYRCPYPGGALYVLADLRGVERGPRPSVSEVIQTAIGTYPGLAIRDAVERYVHKRGVRYTTNDEQVIVEDGPTLSFDDLGRLTTFEEIRRP